MICSAPATREEKKARPLFNFKGQARGKLRRLIAIVKCTGTRYVHLQRKEEGEPQLLFYKRRGPNLFPPTT